jgi:hypothetical protein
LTRNQKQLWSQHGQFADEQIWLSAELVPNWTYTLIVETRLDYPGDFGNYDLLFSTVPEPDTGLLVYCGLVGLGLRRARAH